MNSTRWDEDERVMQAALRATPADALPWAAYADWLEERGRGGAQLLRELAALHTKREGDLEVPELEELRQEVDPLWLVAIGDTQRRLALLAREIDAQREADEYLNEMRQELVERRELRPESATTAMGVFEVNGLLEIEIDLAVLLDWAADQPPASLLRDPSVAPAIRSLYLYQLNSENGTSEIDLAPLLAGEEVFVHLERFATNFYNEHGECELSYEALAEADAARLLDKCPHLKDLSLPSPPGPEFFQRRPHPLQRLRVKGDLVETASNYFLEQVGHLGDLAANPFTASSSNFLLELSRSHCFPDLATVEYEDSRGTASPEQLRALLASAAMRSVQTIRLTRVVLSDAQIAELLAVRSAGVTIDRGA